MQFFQLYQYLVPIFFFPLSYWLWLSRYGGDVTVHTLDKSEGAG